MALLPQTVPSQGAQGQGSLSSRGQGFTVKSAAGGARPLITPRGKFCLASPKGQEQSFPTSALLMLGLRNSVSWGAILCMQRCIAAPPDSTQQSSSTPHGPPSRHFQMFSGAQTLLVKNSWAGAGALPSQNQPYVSLSPALCDFWVLLGSQPG